MTSASELFYTRRSRLGRSDPDSGYDPSINRVFSYHNNHHHHTQNHGNHRRHRHQHRHDTDGCDPLRRSSHSRQFYNRVPFSERSPINSDEGSSQYTSGNNADAEIQRNSRGSLTGNERLPGTVLLARARLLERLRGVSLSGNRQGNRASSANHQRELPLDNEMGLIDSTDWISFFPDLTFQPDGPQLYQECSKKPNGLTQEALNKLDRLVYSSIEVNNNKRDCSICLESFRDGDMLICLPCRHSFHSSCLNPWVRTCGDCPYCRRAIVVSGNGQS